MRKKLIIIGGGAAGFFLAANINPERWDTLILEKANQPLIKVKASGGGRCNLTNATFSVSELVNSYPRGGRELQSVFSRFQPADTFTWFENRGVRLYVCDDGCVFPLSDSSQTVIDVLLNEASKNDVSAKCNSEVISIKYDSKQLYDGKRFAVTTGDGTTYSADALAVTTGSSLKMWKIIETLGHTVVPPVPSLFAMNCKDRILHGLAGTTFPEAELSFPELNVKQSDVLLVTHQGISGPATLKISSFGARKMHEMNFRFSLKLNFISTTREEAFEILTGHKNEHPRKSVFLSHIRQVTGRFWNNLLHVSGIEEKQWAACGNNDFNRIIDVLTDTELKITGRNPYREEFVTAGGVALKEVDFRTMESKLVPNLYFAGEMLDVDALTGGFNLQACWSEAYVISRNLI